MAKLSTLDALFLRLESPESPMHVGLLMICRLPPRAPADYLQQLHARLARSPVESEPFNLRLARSGGLARLAPAWEVASPVDIEYHLRHEALPWPGGERELGLVISRLHSLPLERSRPLWECTLIEGLQPDRFALYIKVHHALGDGVGLMQRVVGGLAESPRGASLPPWSAPASTPPPARPTHAADDDWRRFFKELLAALDTSKPKARRAAPIVPRGPRCVLNGSTTGRRRLATQSLSLPRIVALARAAEATVNDVVLAVCGGALRAYLSRFDRVPKDSLLVTVPVALPRADAGMVGTSVASIYTGLATNLRSPRQRLLAIRDAMRSAKEEFRVVPASLHRAIGTLGMQAMLMVPKRENTDPDKAAFTNLAISNVPGPRQRLYLHGSEIEAMYPLSVLTGDHRLNITVLGYRDQLHCGLVACPDTLPGVQHLALQLPVALEALEARVLPARGRGAPAARGRSRDHSRREVRSEC